MGSSEEGLTTLLKVMENNDCTRLSSKSRSDNGVDLQDKDIEISEELKLGMEFRSHESAYIAYVKYGAKHGFNVRKQHRKTDKTGFVTRVTYCCSKEGHRRNDKRRENVLYSLPISRVGCEAQVVCQLQKNGKFKITAFNASHNHDLIKAPMKHMLRVNRLISKAQKSNVDDAKKSRIPIKETVDLMSREDGGHENFGFVGKDYRNYLCKKRKINMEEGDGAAILHYFQNMPGDISSYFYSMQLDVDDKITNVFWADARSVFDYDVFGDVICFDTTYQINEYGRPFAPIIGVNHHKQMVVFGAALLYDDSKDSFKWLFETFLAAMSGKQPKTILTDQSDSMAAAVLEVFPEACHRLCAWHIYHNAVKNLSHLFHASRKFASDLSKCLYDCEDKDEWLFEWNDMLEKYDLKENKWLKELFEVREKWALVYERHTFTADFMSIQHKESITDGLRLKKYLMPSHDIFCFFEHYEKLLADQRDKELKADFKMIQTIPLLSTNVMMLRHAVEIYTPEVFRLFEKEYMGILDCSVYKVGKSGMTCEYKVSYSGKPQEHLVKFDGSSQAVSCSCMKFNFGGILCSHALKVLDKKNVKRIPHDYILKRWTRDAKARSITNYRGIESNGNHKESIGKRYSHLCSNFREIASFAAEDEKLTAYAHDCSVQLLKSLEEMKKNLCVDNSCVDNNSEGEALLGEISGAQVDMIQHKDCEITKERALKRKYTVRCPCIRLTDSLEKKKHIPQAKATQAATRKGLSMQESVPIGDNLREQQVTGHEFPMFEVLNQGSYMDTSTKVSFPSNNFSATTNLQGTIPFTQHLRGPYTDNGTHVSHSSKSFGATSTFHDSMPFTQLR